jgi:hypothetical protein
MISSNRAEDMTIVHNQGSQVDGDNDPIPENIPVSGTSSTSDLKEGQPWGWTGIDRRRIVQPEKVGPAYSNEMDSSWCCIISCMATVPPIAFLKTILVNISEAIIAIGDPEIVWEELLCFFGM